MFPLWGRDTARLAREMLDGGLCATITCVDPRQLDGAFAGRDFDAALLAELPPGVDPCGERGEFHTFAWAGPMFGRPVPVTRGEVVTREGFVFADLMRQGRGGPSAARTRSRSRRVGSVAACDDGLRCGEPPPALASPVVARRSSDPRLTSRSTPQPRTKVKSVVAAARAVWQPVLDWLERDDDD